MRIGVDIDNVLSNFNDVLMNEYLKHDKQINGNGIVKPEADYLRKMFNWDKQYEMEFYKNNIERFACLFEPIKDCSKYIKMLRKEEFEIIIISGRDNGEYSDPYKMTIDWLKKYDIEYDKLFLVDAYNSHSKTEICLDNNIPIMIDDSKRMCNDIEKNGLKALIMDTPYNRDEQNIQRVYSWKDIYDVLINQKKINVILDTDTYNECDDQFALTYMLKSQNRFNIEAITIAPFSHNSLRKVSVPEGLESSYNEVLKICDWLNFNAANKVFKGSKDYIQNGYDESNDAVNKIIEITLKNNKTYIMAIGAITNVALAIKKEPKIIDKIEIIWLGGNETNYKNNLEYNFRQDIEAVKIVFESGVKLTVIPCKEVASILRIDITTLNEKMSNSTINEYLKQRFYNDGYHGIKESRVLWDISVIAYLINKDWFETKEVSCPKIKDDTSYEMTKNKHTICFVTKINKKYLYNDFFRKVGEE